MIAPFFNNIDLLSSSFIFFISDGNTLISRMATQKKLNASSSGAWTHGRHAEGHTILEFEYRMICTAHYYGKDCDTLCKPRDDQFGHYTCGQDGQKICLQGWQKDMTNPEGDYCTKGKLLLAFSLR